jgi:hypothetical protein
MLIWSKDFPFRTNTITDEENLDCFCKLFQDLRVRFPKTFLFHGRGNISSHFLFYTMSKAFVSKMIGIVRIKT